MQRAAALALALAAGVLATGLAGPAAADTLLSLSATGRVMVHPDQLVAVLRAEATGPSAADAQSQLNTAMTRALALAHQTAGLGIATGAYYVQPPPEHPQPGAGPFWRAVQALRLTGRDGPVLLKLAGALQQQGLSVAQLGWQVAPETLRQAHEAAKQQALGGLRARAESAAGILGLHFDSFRTVRLDAGGPALAVRAMAAPMLAGAAPPVAEAEDQPVEATVQAEALLK